MLTTTPMTIDHQPSTPTIDEMKRIVSELARVKSEQDIEAALAIYHPEGILQSPPMGARSRGADELRRSLEIFFKFAPDYSVQLTGQAADGDTLCSWGTISFTPAYTFRGEKPNGARVTTPVFILFRFKDRKIVWESFHFDLADVAHQASVPAEAYRRS
ncbi:putative ester cyclase [Bradyrhizobium japonicum]|jgi:predicted ester cyclase|uniref:ester cyclase n=1 Tax=Bradyrhizobium TaxID=374 RepID=UPI0003A01945|nr:nuclear transport factor 2 family protein [Bradyrhizobium elkanii]MCP1733335.1 putative ester cyclase [Bradyrhizobium elkanii]MCS3568673.1 putative ester cyclase [Bradyrhizobium elkanii]MCS3589843.1 putative ester cyclase [Bradyrhizobium elkanii]MCS3619285.1 putative ester cyclase [Bradyrhizobium elkanii]MCS3693898.1 putative ester cyclase [Bradyrhizobium elkanii]